MTVWHWTGGSLDRHLAGLFGLERKWVIGQGRKSWNRCDACGFVEEAIISLPYNCRNDFGPTTALACNIGKVFGVLEPFLSSKNGL